MSQSVVEEKPVSDNFPDNPGKMYISPEATRLMIEDITGFKCEIAKKEDMPDLSKQENTIQA